MSKTIIELPNFEGFDYSWIDSEFNVLAENESEYYSNELNLSSTANLQPLQVIPDTLKMLFIL